MASSSQSTGHDYDDLMLHESELTTRVKPRKKRNVAPAYDLSGQRVTRSVGKQIQATPPRDAVFGTHELLENVLSFLPARNIFGVIRVSKPFKAVVDKSPVLQEKMFLRPRLPLTNHTSGRGPYQHVVLNDLPLELPGVQLVFLNPRLEHRLQIRHERTRASRDSAYHNEVVGFWVEDFAPRDPRTGELPAQGHRFLDTYLTDPPCHAITFYLTVEYDVPLNTRNPQAGKRTISVCLSSSGTPNQTALEFGPTIRDLVTAISGWKATHRIYRRPPNGHVREGETWDPNGGVGWYNESSLDEILEHLSSVDKHHAAGIANRRTHLLMWLYGVMVRRP